MDGDRGLLGSVLGLGLGLAGLACRPAATEAPSASAEAAVEPALDPESKSEGAAGLARATEPEPELEPEPEPEPDEVGAAYLAEVEQIGLPLEAETFGPRTSHAPPVPRSTDVDAALTRDLVRRVLREHRRALAACYQTHGSEALDVSAIQQHWVVEGDAMRVEFRWTGAPAAEPTPLLECLEGVANRWRLPAPELGAPPGPPVVPEAAPD